MRINLSIKVIKFIVLFLNLLTIKNSSIFKENAISCDERQYSVLLLKFSFMKQLRNQTLELIQLNETSKV